MHYMYQQYLRCFSLQKISVMEMIIRTVKNLFKIHMQSGKYLKLNYLWLICFLVTIFWWQFMVNMFFGDKILFVIKGCSTRLVFSLPLFFSDSEDTFQLQLLTF